MQKRQNRHGTCWIWIQDFRSIAFRLRLISNHQSSHQLPRRGAKQDFLKGRIERIAALEVHRRRHGTPFPSHIALGSFTSFLRCPRHVHLPPILIATSDSPDRQRGAHRLRCGAIRSITSPVSVSAMSERFHKHSPADFRSGSDSVTRRCRPHVRFARKRKGASTRP
jgi:hypothetical protein